MKKIQLIVFLLLISGLAVNAQTRISGQVQDESGKPLPAATITLRHSADSAMAKIEMTAADGRFSLDSLKPGDYFVSITSVGFQPVNSQLIALKENSPAQLPIFRLAPEAKAMGGVTVTAKKPMVEMKAGKMVVNVDAAPTNAGSTVMELLEKSPGVTVDNDGNISVKGKQGVMVLIDGKPTYMSSTDLAAYLKNMQANQVEQIEIMTNPPAKYDAAGNSGIINIKTKKGAIRGMNGNASLGYSQGIYGRLNGGLNLNYRNNKFNVFGNYYGGTYEGFNRLEISRRLYEADKETVMRTIDQLSRPHYKGHYNSLKIGTDYYFSKKDVIGVVFNGNFNDNKEDPSGRINIRRPDGSLINRLESNGNNDRGSQNYSVNLNYKRTFDSAGRELTTDFDYARYINDNTSFLNTRSFDPSGNKIGPDVLLAGDLPSNISIYSGKVDYLYPVNKTLRLETGVKASFVRTDNEVNYRRNEGTGWVKDNRSNHFIYDENINAAYAIMSGSMKKWDWTAGLRLENTRAKGHQVSNDSTFRRDYTNLFPNAALSYNMNDKNQFSLSYARRVMRPDYDALNPFVFFLDSLTYNQGNPYLLPQFTNNIELSHTFNRFLTTTINYTRTTDVITDLLKQNTEESLTYQTKDNLNTMQQIGLAVMINAPVTKWWNTNIYTNLYRNRYQGLYNNDPVDISVSTFVASANNTFTFGKWSAEVSGWYRSAGTEGLLRAGQMGALNMGVVRQVFNKKGTIKLGVSDVFRTQIFRGDVRYSDVDVDITNRRDSRQLRLNFAYRFGKKNIAPERRRRTGLEDEQNRIKSGN
ncbi:TonB-dependent receptor [Nostoc ellipsosporum NOK]|nr:TonB-dependent receptor [Nostoc ellipsosporum NOK]